jgi:hypothetical protein
MQLSLRSKSSLRQAARAAKSAGGSPPQVARERRADPGDNADRGSAGGGASPELDAALARPLPFRGRVPRWHRGVYGEPRRPQGGRHCAAPRRGKPPCARWRAAHDSTRRPKTAPDHYGCGAERGRCHNATGLARSGGCPSARAPQRVPGCRRGLDAAPAPPTVLVTAAAQRPQRAGPPCSGGARRDAPPPEATRPSGDSAAVASNPRCQIVSRRLRALGKAPFFETIASLPGFGLAPKMYVEGSRMLKAVPFE